MKWFATKQDNRVMWSLSCVMALALMNGPAAGQFDELKLLASDGAAVDGLGRIVSFSGIPGNEVAIVGAFSDADNGFRSGSAYIYRRSGASWVQEAKLLASDGAASDHFGIYVSISGTPGNEVAIVGAYQDDDNGFNSGSAYIYRYNGVSWVEEQKLLASDGAANDHYGETVSISGTPGNEIAIVGAFFHDDNGTNSGSAFIYRFNGVTWVEEQKLLASDGAAGDSFGFSVSFSDIPENEVAIIGAHTDNDNGFQSGSAYIFRFNGVTWVEEQKLLASDGAAMDLFGVSASISGDSGNEIAIVGAGAHDANGADSGSAYIYRFNGVNWVEEAKLLASDGAAGDNFGWVSISISSTFGNEVAIVGAQGHDDNGFNSGSAYIYRFNGVDWVEGQKLLASDGAAGDAFGASVSISGACGNEVAIVGAHRDDNDNGTDSGSAYIYTGLFNSALSCDIDGDGLTDDVETNTGVFVDATDTGTDPNDSDTDDDGLEDGTEVDTAMGSGCPNPVNADSDGDTLLDGAEVAAGTNPCNADTDGDGIPDDIDPFPTDPEGTSGFLEDESRAMADEIQVLSLVLFNGPNNNANQGRRNALANRATDAANAIAAGDIDGAIDSLMSLLAKVDGQSPPPDWMDDSPQKTTLQGQLIFLITLLELL